MYVVIGGLPGSPMRIWDQIFDRTKQGSRAKEKGS